MSKRILCFALVCVLLVSFSACGLIKLDGPSPETDAADTGSSGGQYPRVTYYDNDENMKYAAELQNAHLKYSYGEDHSDGQGAVMYPYEFLNCADYHYHCGYTLVGYDDARHGSLSEPDDHRAIVFRNGCKNEGVLYDFYRKLIVDDYPAVAYEEDRVFLPICPETRAFNVYRVTKDYEEGTKKQGSTDIICERFPLSAIQSLCENAAGFELKKKLIMHTKADHTSEYTEYKFIYDTDTEITLHADFYIDEEPKARLDEAAGEFYYVYVSSLSSVVDVNTYELGKVKPSDVEDKIKEVMSGHESEYKHITSSEYNKIFE